MSFVEQSDTSDCVVFLLYERKARYAGAVPAIHRFPAHLTIGIASLPKRNVSHEQLIFSLAMWAFENGHFEPDCRP